MNNTLKITLIVVAILFGSAILLAGGFFLGRNFFGWSALDAADGRSPFGSMPRFDLQNQPFGMGTGMMGRGFSRQYDRPGQTQLYGMGPGMMGGMMGRGFANYSGETLSIEEAKDAFDSYLAEWGDENLAVHEVMVFDQNAYAVIEEQDTGMAAMELLVDHATGRVFPEYGPNMMWNLKYGMMGGRRGNFGGACCAGGFSINDDFVFEAMPVTLEEAREIAQSDLDASLPGASIAEEGFTFYGYYTFDYEVDGEMYGMLSVNGYNGDVWPHTWHGEFITEVEFD